MNTRVSILLSAAAAALTLAAASSAGATILVNGGFEQPGGSVRDQLTPNYLPGWTYTDNETGFDIYEEDTQDQLAAADGSHYVSFGHNGTTGGEISQTFATIANQTYTITYSVAEQQGIDADQDLLATLVNGSETISQNNTNLPDVFTPNKFGITFVANGTSATIRFTDNTAPGGGADSNLVLDAVRVTGPEVGGGVPEPAAWALMLVGFGGMGATLRLRRKAVAA